MQFYCVFKFIFFLIYPNKNKIYFHNSSEETINATLLHL